ncbi:MAG: hypothetical protein JWO17_2841, partial [Actinomycetia bacterium]|nr:hypothetical protein [Actinomycetes bacterium]
MCKDLSHDVVLIHEGKERDARH